MSTTPSPWTPPPLSSVDPPAAPAGGTEAEQTPEDGAAGELLPSWLDARESDEHPPAAPLGNVSASLDKGTTVSDEPSDPKSPPTADKGLRWIRPAASDHALVSEGYYAGRVQAGDGGAILRVLPSVRSKISGAYVADSSVDAAAVSDSVSVGVVSVKGASHHLSGTPRQDAYAIGSDDAWVVVAVADGVSEGRLSHVAAAEAARVAVSEALRALVASGPEVVDWSAVAGRVRVAVRALGQRRAQHQLGPSEILPEIPDRTIARLMSTTCDLIVVPVARCEGSLRVWRVRVAGDGSFYALDRHRGWGLIGAGKDPTSSAIDNAVRDPLPLGGDKPDVASWELEPGQAVVLCTDGFGDVIGEGARPVGRYLFDAWQRPLDTVQLLRTSSFINTNADDDRTAAIVWATA